jgi:hypothetical protein
MTLGQVLAKLGDEDFAAEALIGLGDLPLVVEVEAMAECRGEDARSYAANAARHFTGHASNEDWLALMTALGHADDPGVACLRQMLVWSLRHDNGAGCGCSGNSKGA